MTDAETYGYKPYPSYKISGASWLGEIPEHWEARQIRTVARVMNGATPSTSVPEYWDGDVVWITPDDLGKSRGRFITGSERRITQAGYEACGTNLAPPGSIVLSTRAPIGHIGVLRSPACTNQGCRLLSVKGNFQSTFAFYQLTAARPELESLGQGTTFTELSKGTLAAFPVALPPVDEQATIVRYLDDADQRIRAYVSAKERLIALLEEERQAVIHQAVTKGLDPNVELKPSGVEWLGDVPEHWGVTPVKRAFRSIDYGISESASNSGAIRLLTMGHVKDGKVIVPQVGGVENVDPDLLLDKGDLLFNRTNSQELVGKVGLFEGNESPVTFASYLVRLRPSSAHEPEFLNMALNDTSFISRARREAIPSLHQSNLNPTRYGRIHIALPSKKEQRTILHSLSKKTETLTNAIDRSRRQMELMEEYRTRLIAEVVTGKLDVREAKP